MIFTFLHTFIEDDIQVWIRNDALLPFLTFVLQKTTIEPQDLSRTTAATTNMNKKKRALLTTKVTTIATTLTKQKVILFDALVYFYDS